MARQHDEFDPSTFIAPPPPPPPTPPSQPGAGADPDPFDPERLRLAHDFSVTGGVHHHPVSLPVRKPTKAEWFRTRPGDYVLDTRVLELPDGGQIYLVDPALWDELADEPTVGVRRLALATNRARGLFLWPLKLPAGNRGDRWAESALLALEASRTEWVRIRSDQTAGAYEFHTPVTPPPEPTWPELSMGQALCLAFRSAYIGELDHPVLRQLRGEV